MVNLLYILLIYPVCLLVETVLFFANTLTQDHIGLSIIVLSVAVNLICLPIYNVAEQWQKKERAIQNKMKNKIADIKAVFRGDERYMILSTFYRQNHYHPLYALRSSFALLIQIPFFIAAYSLLSHLPSLSGSTFFFLKDLSKPDALIQINGLTINLLPILMTIINVLASYIYVKGFPLKDKLQLYIISALFLLLLYRSPSGLVLYWTFNNVFSLLKNVFYKVKISNKMWYYTALISFSIIAALTIFTTEERKSIFISGSILLCILFLPVIKKVNNYLDSKHRNSIFDDSKKVTGLFIQSLLCFWIVVGLTIPAMTIASSALEFAHVENMTNPLSLLGVSSIQVLGCGLWCFCIFTLFGEKTKKYLTFVSICILLIALANTFILTGNYGDINNTFIFENPELVKPHFSFFLVYAELMLLLTVIIAAILIYSKFSHYLPHILNIVILTVLLLTAYSAISIQKEYSAMDYGSAAPKTQEKAYRISKNGKNVIIIMLDRAMNFFLDPIFEHSKMVRNEYTGFKLFKNTTSYGLYTNVSTPSMFGGYEYTPDRLNKRKNELMIDKHNESLSVLPKLFIENGWLVSFTDPPWLNYSVIPDLSIFNEFKKDGMRAANIDTTGKYTRQFLRKMNIVSESKEKQYKPQGIKKNILSFSFFRIFSPILRFVFYNNGQYINLELPVFDALFCNSYGALDNLDKEVEFVNDENCINIIANIITHQPPRDLTLKFLKLQDDTLIPQAKKYCLDQYTVRHYYANYYAHELLAQFFKFLKENNCYDNSRILIVSDHGADNMHTIDMKFLEKFEKTGISISRLIPLLMIKDFNQKGSLTVDNSFMTLADIPLLATEGLNKNLQKNPFTGVSFKESQNKAVVKIASKADWNANKQKTYKQLKIKPEDWLSVKNNVYDPTCWSRDDFGKDK